MSRHAYGDGWNFWVVKYLRQMRHDFALPVAVIILLVIEFIIFRSFLGQRHYSPQWRATVPNAVVIVLLRTCPAGSLPVIDCIRVRYYIFFRIVQNAHIGRCTVAVDKRYGDQLFGLFCDFVVIAVRIAIKANRK